MNSKFVHCKYWGKNEFDLAFHFKPTIWSRKKRFFELENPMKAVIITKSRGRRSRAVAAA